MNYKTLEIDIGSTTVKIAILDENENLIFADYKRHFANIQETLADLLQEAFDQYGEMTLHPVITGSGGLTLANHLGVPFTQEVIAVSTYAGRTVRGVAKCDPKDTFDIEKGKQLAAARCQAKVSSQRLKRATKKLDEALLALEKAQKYYDDMTVYFNDSARDKEMFDSVAEKLAKEM